MTPLRNQTVEDVLAEAQVGYAEKRPRARAAHEAATKVMPGGNPRTTLFHGPLPLRIANGWDAMLTNVDGFAHLNFLGDYTAGVLGHSHPVIRKAIGRALDAGMSFGAQNAYEPEFARLVVTTRGPLLGPRITEAGT